MKKVILILVCLAWLFPFTLQAQGPGPGGEPPPNPPGEHGSSSNQTGGNAPIGNGLYILLAMGAVYGSKKLYEYRKQLAND